MAPSSVPAAPAVPEARLLTLEYPPAIREGDSDVVRLTLQVDTRGNITPTAEIQGHTVNGQTITIPNVYDTANVVAQARLDMSGVQVMPADLVEEPLLPGQDVTFFWSVQPNGVGTFRGTVWLYLEFVPLNGGATTRQAVSAQMIQITTTSLFGLSAGPARWLGFAGTVISSILGLPFLEDVIRWLFGRSRGRKS